MSGADQPRTARTPRTPRWATALVARVLPPADRRDVLGDLEERHARLQRERGTIRAWFWYWRQALQFAWRIPAAGASDAADRPSGLGVGFAADVRHALRGLLAQPSLTAVVVATLALAIGANTAIFSVVDAVVISPLGYEDSDRLVRVYQYYSESGEYEGVPVDLTVVSPLDYVDYRERGEIFEALAAYGDYRPAGFDLTGHGEPMRIRALPVSSDYHDVYRVQPLLGRAFERREEDGEHRVVLISYGLWQRLYAGDPAILGETLTLNDAAWEIVGVMPSDFVDVVRGQVDIWVPHDTSEGGFNTRGNHYMSVVGRLAPGVSLEQARAALAAWDRELARTYPDTNEARFAAILPLHQAAVGDAATMLWVLLGATGLVLLIGCVNVANLLIGRALTRRKETAVRVALGSSRLRLVRQAIIDSTVLALLGGGVGIALAAAVTRWLTRLAPVDLPMLHEVSLDLRVLGFAVLASLLTGMAFGVGPAIRSASSTPEVALRESSRGSSGGAGTQRLRGALVVSEVALALVLLIGAGLMLRTFAGLQARDLGVEVDGVSTFELQLPVVRYADASERESFYRQLQVRLEGLPGVVSSGSVQWLPGTGSYNSWGFVRDPEGGELVFNPVNVRVIGGNYMDAVGLELLRGRAFDSRDELGSPWVVYLNEAAVQAGWPDGGDPLGEIVMVGENECEVVGIVEDSLLTPRSTAPTPKLYFTHAQYSERHWSMFQVVKTSGPVEGLMSLVRAEVAAIDPALVAYNARSLRVAVGSGVADTRFVMLLLVAFAGLAVLLAVIGTYGVLAYSFAQRRREIGIRMALGAQAGQVRGMVLRQAMALGAAGTGLGFLIAVLATRSLESLLFGVEPLDPLVFVSVGLAVLGLAAVAAWLPARRATRVNPVQVLR